ncbi:hypothetical protein U9M48_008318 [Paspalum notatum var. saurae]|uniref:Myb/SANT-like domain-containing protein n=1 Tax=Paspalum notatum var. saurae TaxID=547442 RepID=A0AAQ3WDF3_PASNO
MDKVEGQGETNGIATWTSIQSAFMFFHLANVVASGAKTPLRFKKSHLNACAKANQVKNHLKTWSLKFQKYKKLKTISGAGWDEDNFIITLAEDHFNNYVATHKVDAEYLNKPLEHYGEMQTIFVNSMTTEMYAKDSISTLGPENMDIENEDLREIDFNDAIAFPSCQTTHYDLYFGYIMGNPHIGKAFYKVPFVSKLTRLSAYVSERVSRQ